MGKRLGQHFLINPDTARRIVEILSPEPGDNILEIGPGRGAITEFLIDSGSNLTAVEIDDDLAGYIKTAYASRIRVINDDFLRISLLDYSHDKICGNLPYQVTGPILEKVLTSSSSWKKAVFMIPEAVARRAVASPGDSEYSAISVICSGGYRSYYTFRVPPEDFNPPPKIDSAVLMIKKESMPEEAGFYSFVKSSFSRRRKKLKNSLGISLGLPSGTVAEVMRSSDIDEELRPQDLSFEEYKSLYLEFVKNKLF